MASKFEKWWENIGFFKAKEQNIVDDPVEIARLAYEAGLNTSPYEMTPLGKSPEFDFPTHLVKCNCTCQMLEIERYDWKDGDQGFNLTMWQRGRDGKKIHGWKERFRWCWNILTTGNPWTDDIIVTNKDAKGIAEFILQNLPNEEK